MNKRKNSLKVKILSLVISVALFTGATMAYFTDRAAAFFRGHTGTVEISSTRPFAKMPAIYDGMNNASLTVKNNGNAAMDIRVVMKIATPTSMTDVASDNTSGTHMLSTFVEGTQYSLPLYRVFNDKNKTYSVSLSNGTATEDGDFIPGTADNSNTMSYIFDGTLNGKDTGNGYFETVTNGVNVLDIPIYLYFSSFDEASNWASISKDLCYTVTVKVYGKQHRNSDNADWTLLGIV